MEDIIHQKFQEFDFFFFSKSKALSQKYIESENGEGMVNPIQKDKDKLETSQKGIRNSGPGITAVRISKVSKSQTLPLCVAVADDPQT